MSQNDADQSGGFDVAFDALTGNPPFPWQRALYDRLLSDRKDNIPVSCNLPTGLGKTSVITIWLLALAAAPTKVPRRLVYVVNRRTVVDQSTREAEKLRECLPSVPVIFAALRNLCGFQPENDPKWSPLAISTLRGQFADNREWSADPARPAVIVGTVDMVGSRLLFSGYGVGFKSKPLHAGFLGQDALLVHDEAHLEPAFQELLTAIQKEQGRCHDFVRFHVMELSATSRGKGEAFELTEEEQHPPDIIPNPPQRPIHYVWRRQKAKKSIHLHENLDAKKLADEITELALSHRDSGRAVLIFARTVENVDRIADKLRKAKQHVETLTGTMRGLERDGLVKRPIFQRFLPESNRDKDVTPAEGTVYLICTSAGEVGVNISADHLVCDLSTFESIAQRLGRVNRFGDRDDTRIDIVHPKSFDQDDDYESRLKQTLKLLRDLNGDGSPSALGNLDPKTRLAAFAPTPIVLPVSEILFDAWAFSTIRGKLPGRPMIEPYLHGKSEWEPPETHVAWREEVWEFRAKFESKQEQTERDPRERKRLAKLATEILEDYPLKPHELLRDNSNRVFDRLSKLKASKETPAWIISDDDSVEVTTLAEVIEAGKEGLGYKTVLLPPFAGGLDHGMLTSNSALANDVADEWRDENGKQRRLRVWDDDDPRTDGMRLVRRIDFPASEDDEGEGRSWYWYESVSAGDSDGSRASRKPVLWQVHTDDVIRNTKQFIEKLPLPDELKNALVLSAEWHDLGKRRHPFQRLLGNRNPDIVLAKSGKRNAAKGLQENFRHEFGSLVDVLDAKQPYLARFRSLSTDMQDLVLHVIAAHHGRGRPLFPIDEAFDPDAMESTVDDITVAVPRRFAHLQRRYGRWGLAYVESLLRAADYAASAKPSKFLEVTP